MAAKNKKSDFISTGPVAQNRRAGFDYFINEKFVAGLELTGTEVKSLRLGHANINDAFGVEKNGELYISNMFIAEYANKGYESHAEKRDRKLLLKKKEINDIVSALAKKAPPWWQSGCFLTKRAAPSWKWDWEPAKRTLTSGKPSKTVTGTGKRPG